MIIFLLLSPFLILIVSVTVLANIVFSSAIGDDSTKLSRNVTVSDGNQLFVSLTSDKTKYSSEDMISLNGNAKNGIEPVANHRVIIEAFNGNNLTHRYSAITNGNGGFFQPYQYPKKVL